MNLKLLTQLVHRWVEAEAKHQRFKTCVLMQLSKIEATLTQSLGCQLAQYWPEGPRMKGELRDQYIREVQEKIENDSQSLGVKMMRFTHEEPEKPEERFDRRRKWWGWEI